MATWKKILTSGTVTHVDLATSPTDGYVLTASSGTDGGTPAWEAASGGVTNSGMLTLLSGLESAGGTANENIVVGTDVDDTIKFSGNVTVDGNFVVSGDTTTLNVSTLTVEDKIIELAYAANSAATADASGININTTNATKEPTLEWTNVSGLAQWGLYQEGDAKSYPISIMDSMTGASTVPTGNKAGVGCFCYNTDDDLLYIRTS